MVVEVELIIRKVKLKDSKELALLGIDFLKQHGKYSPVDILRHLFLKKEVNSWNKMIKGEKYIIFVAEGDGKILGVINLTFPKRYYFKKIQKIGEIEVLAVHKNYRSKGIGKALVGYAFEFFKKKKVPYVTINVRLKNPALKFWKKQGFKEYDVKLLKKI